MLKPQRPKRLTSYEIQQRNTDTGYCKGGMCDSTDCYQEFIDEILRRDPTLKRDDVYMLDHEIVGEVCVHIRGKWAGYVDGFFYEDDIANWVWYCNQQNN